MGRLVQGPSPGLNQNPSEFNQAEWMLNHTALLNKRKANWKHGGFDVNIEGQNSFELRGRSATLAGKPDLVARKADGAVIIDAKTGQESPSHVVQVMIYLYAIPRALEQYRNIKLRGPVTYSNPCEYTVRTTYVIRSNEYRVMLQGNRTLTTDFLSRPLPAVVNPAKAGIQYSKSPVSLPMSSFCGVWTQATAGVTGP